MDRYKRYRKNHPERLAARDHAYRQRDDVKQRLRDQARLRDYGITPTDFQQLIEDQENRCAICGREFVDTPQVDHDHSTGEFRGLLCRTCNGGLGMFGDDPNLMELGAAYLRTAL